MPGLRSLSCTLSETLPMQVSFPLPSDPFTHTPTHYQHPRSVLLDCLKRQQSCSLSSDNTKKERRFFGASSALMSCFPRIKQFQACPGSGQTGRCNSGLRCGIISAISEYSEQILLHRTITEETHQACSFLFSSAHC